MNALRMLITLTSSRSQNEDNPLEDLSPQEEVLGSFPVSLQENTSYIHWWKVPSYWFSSRKEAKGRGCFK